MLGVSLKASLVENVNCSAHHIGSLVVLERGCVVFVCVESCMALLIVSSDMGEKSMSRSKSS